MYGNLIELSVDASELENRLADIDQKLADATVMDEDAVTRIIEGYDYATNGDLGTYITNDDFDSRVEDVLNSGDYATTYDVDSKIDDKFERIGDFATEHDLANLDRRIDRVAHNLEQRIESITAAALSAESLEGRVEALDERVEILERNENLNERMAALEGLDRETSDRIGDLASLLGNANARLDLQNQRIAELETRLADRGELGMALTFFGLLRQAFAALR